jgi:hypothetical protein
MRGMYQRKPVQREFYFLILDEKIVVAMKLIMVEEHSEFVHTFKGHLIYRLIELLKINFNCLTMLVFSHGRSKSFRP